MRFFENIAKQIFSQEGIPILEGHVAYSPEEAMTISSEMGVPVVVKAQVLTGGRGKAGGVKFANNPGEALKVAEEILGMEIKGEKVKHLLIEKKAEILNEFFVTVSASYFSNTLYNFQIMSPIAEINSDGTPILRAISRAS